jgi:hypothetical protein
MTNDDIVRMADLADYHADSLEFIGKLNGKTWKEVRDHYLAVLVAKAEREACADMVLTLTCMGNAKECFEVAATYIRARGQ